MYEGDKRTYGGSERNSIVEGLSKQTYGYCSTLVCR